MKEGNWKKRLLAATLCAGLVFQSFPAEASAAIPAEETFQAAEEDAYLSEDEMPAEDVVSEVGEMPEEDVVSEDSEKPEDDIASEVGETPIEDAVPEDGEIPEEDVSLAAGMDGEAALLQEAEEQMVSSSVPAVGKGTEKNPYLITNEEELGMISNALDAHWKLAGDIILEKEFAPIPEFSGTLDGDGYRICGTIGSIISKEPVLGVAYEVKTGLIKENKGTIKNLCLEVEISSGSYGLQGGFLAYENQNGGLIENCCISGKLHIAERDQNYGYYNFNAAGAVYLNEGTIRNCYAKIRIDGGCRPGPDIDINVGGFLGRLYGTGTVENCYSVSDSFGDYEGCFLLNNDANGTVKSCYYDGDTITDEYMYTDGSGYYARHTGAMKWQPNYKGWDFDKVWAIDAAVNDGYPYLRCQQSAEPQGTLPSTLTGRGTEKDPFLITSEEQLEMVGGASDAYWKLACDIVLEKEFMQLPEFSGTLDGDGYRICGTVIAPIHQPYSTTYDVGFIKENTGTIKNLCLEAEATVNAFSLDGALLVYANSGLIENCSIAGTLHIIEQDHWYPWQFKLHVGGAVSKNEGTIRNCYAKVFLDGTYMTSSQGEGVGGFLGALGENGTVENCYSISVSGSKQPGAYNNGVGRFLADSTGQGTVKSCYYDGDIITEGKYVSVDGSGYYARHTSAMKLQLNYKDWDFDHVWAIDPAANDGYPYLRSQKSVIVKPQDIVLDRKEIYLVEEAEPFQLRASIIPGNASNKNITWSSSDKYVASVDEKNGTVTPVSEGEATITATTEEGGLTASCKVNVIRADDKTPYVAEVIVSPSQAELKPGEECQFTAEVKGINNPGTGVQWAVSENKSISTTITSSGLLKVAENESAEEFTVTAMSAADSSKKTSVKVTVLQEGADPEQPYVYETLPDGTVQINKYKGNDTQIEVPDKIDGKEVSAIGESAFQGLENITSVKLPESIGKIGSGAFAWCTGLASVNLPAGMTELAETTFYGCAALKTVSLPEGVTSVGDYAFYDCTVLNNIYLPEGVTSIGAYAFYGCSGLKKVSYGGNESQWKQIQVGEENGCLTQAEVAYGSKAPEPEDPEDPGKGDADPASYVYETLSDGTIKVEGYKGDSSAISIPEEIDGKKVRVIGENAFQGLGSLVSVKLPGSITEIEKGAFANCPSLKSVNLPSKITEIPETAFYGCAALKTVSLPEGVASVGEYAFYDCAILDNIYLPSGLKTVGDYAFYGCIGLKKVAYGGNEGQWKQIQIGKENGCLTQAEVAYGSKAPEPEDPEDPGKGDADPASYEYETLSDGTVKIKGYRGTASKLSIPEEIGGEKVSVIGENAFQGLENITSVYLPDSIEEMESGAFANCTGLVSVKLPSKITKIAETAFYGCAALVSVNVPDGVREIEDYAFYGCTSLDNIYLPASLKMVGDYAFYECSGLKKVSYGGSQNQWKQMQIGIENECLQKAEVAYNSKMPEPDPDDPDAPDNPGEEDNTSEVLLEDIPYIPGPQLRSGFWGVTTEEEYVYTRKAIKPEVHVYYRESLGGGSYVDRMAEEGLDYTLSYRNNLKASRMYEASAGQSYVVVTGKNLYKGRTGKITFVIQPAPLKNILSEDAAAVYNGKEQKTLPSLSYNGKKLSYKKDISKTDFTVSWPDISKGAYVEPGTYEMVLTGRNNFTGELKVKLVITSRDRLISRASVKIPAQPYNDGKQIRPAFDVRLKGVTLKNNIDYRVVYQNNTQIGTATAVIYGIYPYGGVKRVNFKITGTSLKKARVSYAKQMPYNGSYRVQDNLDVSMSYESLVEGEDYKVIYAKNKNAGKASFTIVGINQYTGQIRKTFKITPCSINDVQGFDRKINAGPESLESGKYKPKISLSFKGRKLTEGRDYTVSYKNNRISASGQPMITVKGKGNFKGSRTIRFTIE